MAGDNNAKPKRFAKLNGWLWRIVFAALGFGVGVGIAWGTVTTEVSDLKECTDDHEDRLRNIEKFAPRIDQALSDIDRRLSNIETQVK